MLRTTATDTNIFCMLPSLPSSNTSSGVGRSAGCAAPLAGQLSRHRPPAGAVLSCCGVCVCSHVRRNHPRECKFTIDGYVNVNCATQRAFFPETHTIGPGGGTIGATTGGGGGGAYGAGAGAAHGAHTPAAAALTTRMDSAHAPLMRGFLCAAHAASFMAASALRSDFRFSAIACSRRACRGVGQACV